MARKMSPLAQAASAVRSDVKAAVADCTLPPYPDGITFRVRSERASLMQSVDIDVCNVPCDWLIDKSIGVNRVSEAWTALPEALQSIAERHWDADGSMTFIGVQAFTVNDLEN